MAVARRYAVFGVCLLGGALLVGVAGLRHPILNGDGAEQLATIAATPEWRTIHWMLLFGLPFMLTGLLGVVARHLDSPGASTARTAAVVATFGFAVLSLNMLFMVGAGAHLAGAYAAADLGLTATRAVFLYDMLHPFGLAAERLATFTLGVAFTAFGVALWQGRVWSRWMAWGALAGGIASVVIALVVPETSVLLFVGQGILTVWMAAAGVVMLTERRPA